MKRKGLLVGDSNTLVQAETDIERLTAPAGNTDSQTDTSVAWILIFTDMVALLLSFFVMLFSMSAVPVNEWETTIDILEEALNLSGIEELEFKKECARARRARKIISIIISMRAQNHQH